MSIFLSEKPTLRKVTAFHRCTVLCFLGRIPLAEEQRNAPYRRNANQRIYDPADGRSLSAEQVRDKVKAEESDKAPVQPANDGKDECDSVNDHVFGSFAGFAQHDRALLSFPEKKKIYARQK